MNDCPQCHGLLGRRRNPKFGQGNDVDQFILDCTTCGWTERTQEDTWRVDNKLGSRSVSDLSWWWGNPGGSAESDR